MKRIEISLNEVEKVYRFVNLCSNKYEDDINVYSGRLILDAKSIMGMFSIDLSKPVEVEILTPNTEVAANFVEDMKAFMKSQNE